MGLEGHTALVTGGSTGIGRAIAVELARRGAQVAVNYRREGSAIRETLTALAETGRPHLGVAADVRNKEQVREMVATIKERLGVVDILVNNAGVGVWGHITEFSEEDWHNTIDTNLKAAFLCAQAVAPGMMERGWGRIVNITSTGSVRMIRGMSAYCASKAGLAMLTYGMAVDLGQYGITANGVGPSTVPTAMNAADLAKPGFLEAEQKANPSGRIGTLDDIACAVAFLASHEAGWINGQNLIVDGGLTTLSPQPEYN